MQHYLCVTCGTQYGESEEPPARCVICEDDRQYVPPAGQQWTTLAQEQGRHTNTVAEIAAGIGQHAHLLRTEGGNVLWDCVAYLDEPTVAAVQELGGIAAIAISHPHFFTTIIRWSKLHGAGLAVSAAGRQSSGR